MLFVFRFPFYFTIVCDICQCVKTNHGKIVTEATVAFIVFLDTVLEDRSKIQTGQVQLLIDLGTLKI